MNAIQIGKVISNKRKDKGITQEELASHLGVSKPAVSKWESGLSYPDILLLPMLASYFDISIDELIGYEPQMEKEDVRWLYQRFAEAFAREPFDKVFAECEEYIKKYYSCWYLLFKMALLYINHCMLTGSAERTNEVLKEALELFDRVEKSCEDVNLAKQARQLKALCYMSLQNPTEAIEILEGMNEPQVSPESLLIKAYQMKGDKEKAIEYLQGNTYTSLNNILSFAPDFFTLYADQPKRIERLYCIFQKLIDIFELEQPQVSGIYNFYLAAATAYVMQGKNKEALDALEKYVELANKSDHGLFILHGNGIFDNLENYLKSIDVETTAPRSSEVIWRDMKNIILNNPSFAPLEGEERFQQLKKRMDH